MEKSQMMFWTRSKQKCGDFVIFLLIFFLSFTCFLPETFLKNNFEDIVLVS